MSRVEYSNRTIVDAIHMVSSQPGELMQQDRITIRGKGRKETRKESFDATFTFSNSLSCKGNEAPLIGDNLITYDDPTEAMKLICQFSTKLERSAWVSQTLELTGASNT